MGKKSSSGGSLMEELAFWAVIFLALVMLLSTGASLLHTWGVEIPSLESIMGILNRISLAIAIAITICCSYRAARRKGRKWFVVWVVCAILVGLSFVFGISIL
ncbi:MAG: hypothetical protein J6K61_01860 [Clostridia bacterium]|nr:hypothetical protein [Clostridia bacterium]